MACMSPLSTMHVFTIPMEPEEVLARLRTEPGVVRVEVMPDALCGSVVREESTVTAAGGMMDVRNLGLDEVMGRSLRLVLFVDTSFEVPSGAPMRMVDSAGNLLGHQIPKGDVPKYVGRHDVTFLSDDFVMYDDVAVVDDMTMEMPPIPYRGTDDWVPGSAGPVIWFPSTTGSMVVHRHFGQPIDDLATALMGLDL